MPQDQVSSDEARWDQRYKEGAYADRGHPSPYLEQWLPKLQESTGPDRIAADLACGRGRNCRYLAAQGWQVDGYDVSGQALELAAAETDTSAHIAWHKRDLVEQGLPRGTRYDLLVVTRFFAPELFKSLHGYVRESGWVLIECHLKWPGEGIGGPRSDRFRASPGELQTCLQGFEFVHTYEGEVQDPDGTNMALAQVLARSSPTPSTR